MILGDLVSASHILAHEDVLDVFGHVSCRNPKRPDRFFLSRSRSPQVVAVADMLEFGLDSEPVEPTREPLFAERVIHGGLYGRRQDVNAVCHFHAPAVMPFCITGTPIVPVCHVGAVMGPQVPFWSMRDTFGDTNMLVATREQADSLAAALGDGTAVLMRNHGAVVVAGSIRELVFRCIHFCLNARLQREALALGGASPLTAGEIALAGALADSVYERAWDYWVHRLSARHKI